MARQRPHPPPVAQPPGTHQPPRHFHKQRRPFGSPIAIPKDFPAYEPPPFTNLQYLNLPLHAVVPSDEERILNAGKIVFHTVGDTGGVNGTDTQDAIARQMEAQCAAATEAEKPAFFYHLGDVVYYNGQSYLYRSQFYEPYQYYPPPIFAIPGNHDGDTHVRPGDAPDPETTLYGFLQNFCDDQPHHLFPYRPTMTQPYVYWTLDAPFVTLIGLYSNVDGLLDGRGTNEQQRWLQNQLAAAPQGKCLLVAVHHPPYSLDAVHGGTPDIVDALERAMAVSQRIPDAVFSGHVHSYQRFTRLKDNRQIPYVVAGAGGYINKKGALHKLQRDPANDSAIQTPFETTEPGVTLQAYNETDSGFLRMMIDQQTLRGEYFTVPFEGEASASAYDTFTLDWKRHRVT
jgi:hypothetical protein